MTISTVAACRRPPSSVAAAGADGTTPTTTRAASTRRRSTTSIRPPARSRRTALTTNYYYDHRGDLIEPSRDPGGLVDQGQLRRGRPRLVVQVHDRRRQRHHLGRRRQRSRDTVLEQTRPSTTATATSSRPSTAALRRRDGDRRAGQPDTDPPARVYYAADYYDAADRLTATVDVGTNGGSAWTRPSTVPAASGHRAGDQLHLQRGRLGAGRHHRPARHRHADRSTTPWAAPRQTIEDYTDGADDDRNGPPSTPTTATTTS